ncbi:MAG: CotH kinase family protein [Clostridiales bacterium]|nr:CotH kinase family protein [Clostridiales bacterium]
MQRLFAAICTCCMLFCAIPLRTGAKTVSDFVDLETGAWYEQAAAWSVESGVIQGMDKTHFAPNDPVTREMFAAMLYRFAQNVGTATDETDVKLPFTDIIEGEYYISALQWAYATGIIAGVAPDQFGVGQIVTREQVCAMAVRYCEGLIGGSLPTQGAQAYLDQRYVSSYAQNSVLAARLAGLMTGESEEMFHPQGVMTRAQTAQLLYFLSQNDPQEPVHSYIEQTEYVPATGGICREAVKQCKVCGTVFSRVEQENGRMPVLELTGDFSEIDKDVEITIQANYDAADLTFSSVATVEYQGSSSLNYEKKNYNIRFYEDETLENKNKIDLGWGRENKYTLKANYIDYSQSRNIVSAKLWGDIVRSRPMQPQPLIEKINGGAIDGFPVLLYFNGEYQGVYTFNIPKDKWSLETDEYPVMAMMSTNDWSDACNFRAPAVEGEGNWEVEENEMGEDSVVFASINALIDFVRNNAGQSFESGIGTYLDVESYIDYMIFAMVGTMRDNVAKNCMFVTYDGVKWYTTMYDMDSTWGLYWDGSRYYNTGMLVPQVNGGRITVDEVNNLLWARMFESFAPEIRARYMELRQSVLSEEHILQRFSDFMSMIPQDVMDAEKLLYPNEPNMDTNNLETISTQLSAHLRTLDFAMERFPQA